MAATTSFVVTAVETSFVITAVTTKFVVTPVNHWTKLKGPIELENFTKSGKSPKGRGEGASKKNQKVQNSKFGLFDQEEGGVWIFCFKHLLFLFRGEVLEIQNFPNFKFIPIRFKGGGVIKFPMFSKFKKVQILEEGGGGSRKIVTVSTFCDIFF